MKEILKNSLITKKLYFLVRKVYYDIFWGCFLMKCHKDPKIVLYEGYGKLKGHSLKKSNWGDDLNKYFFEYIGAGKLILSPISQVSPKYVYEHYSLIGSILGYFNLDNTIVYGSGVMDENTKFLGKPKKIISVRGPKSREVLIENGFECPEAYGDPALLLPVFYKPKNMLHNKALIIPNMGSASSSDKIIIAKLALELNADILDMTKYNEWTYIIDKIASSQYVISESLHGLIVAETYGIPNVWVEFKDHPDYWNFKFEDYYRSIGKEERIIKVQDIVDIEAIKRKIEKWEKGNIDYKKLLSYLPFKIKCPINNEVLEDNV